MRRHARKHCWYFRLQGRATPILLVGRGYLRRKHVISVANTYPLYTLPQPEQLKQLENIQLHIFCAIEHRVHLHEICTSVVKTGILDSVGLGYNKGGVMASFSLYGRRYCFINCHLVRNIVVWANLCIAPLPCSLHRVSSWVRTSLCGPLF